MKTLVLYGSLTGNTEATAQQISAFLDNHQVKHDLASAYDFSPEKVLTYDLLVLGSATWDYGQFQEYFAEFFEAVQDFDFSDKKFIAFGCGDSSYVDFCKAVDMIEDFWTKKKAIKLGPGLKIDGFPFQPENQKLIEDWLEKLIKIIK